MSRRNTYLLVLVTVVCGACYLRTDRYVQVVSYAMRQIDQRAYHHPGRRELAEGALDGMMRQLNDDNSSYMAPKPSGRFRNELDSVVEGIGVELLQEPETKRFCIAGVLHGSPAETAGLRIGDQIVEIDGKPIAGWLMDDVAAAVRGAPDTAVTLKVERLDKTTAEIRVVRARVQIDNVQGQSRNPDGTWNFFLEGAPRVGYVKIVNFGENAAAELRDALERLKAAGARTLVLDLRDNPGGLLQEAVGICRLFVESGTLVTTRRDDQTVKKEHLADGSTAGLDVPIAVLVNRGTASASEIVAACLQDHRLATIVGQRTYGKGTVQEVIELPWGQGALRLTTSSYWRPSGVNINRRKDASEKEEWGVSPDPGCAVKLTGAQIEKLIRWRQQRRLDQANGANRAEPQTELDVDPQLARAVQSVLARLKPAPPRSP